MTISFLLGPNLLALIRRLIAVYVISEAAAVIVQAFAFYTPLLQLAFLLVGGILTLLMIGLLIGIVRRTAMLLLPSRARQWRIFDDAYILKLLRTQERQVSWIWTPITMASLLIYTVSLIDYAFIRWGGVRFYSYQSYSQHLTMVTAISLVLSMFGMLAGTRFISGAKASLGGHFGVEYLPDDHWLTQRVGALADKLGLEKRPEVGVTEVYNAFAMGRRSNAIVVIGKPLIATLSEDELNAVIGHELGHVHSNDMQRMQFAEGFQRMLGNTILVISTLGIRLLAKDRAGVTIGHAVSGLFRHTVFIGTELAVKGLSRSREYVADATGAQLSSPEAMISALERVHGVAAKPTAAESRYGYLMFKGSSLGVFFSTHPTLDARVRSLRKLTTGSNPPEASEPEDEAGQFRADDISEPAPAAGSLGLTAGRTVKSGVVAVREAAGGRWKKILAGVVVLVLVAPALISYYQLDQRARDLSTSATQAANRSVAWLGSLPGGLNTTFRKLDGSDAEIAQLKTENVGLQSENRQLARNLVEVKQERASLATQAEWLPKVQRDLNFANQKIASLEQQVRQQGSVNGLNDVQQSQIKALQAEIATRKRQNDRDYEALTSLRAQNRDLEDKLASHGSGTTAGPAQPSENVDGRLAYLTENNGKLLNRIDELQKELTSLRAENGKLSASNPKPVSTSTPASENIEGRLAYLTENNSYLLNRVDELQKALDAAKKGTPTASDTANMTGELASRDQQIADLQRRNNELQSKVIQTPAPSPAEAPPTTPPAVWGAAVVDHRGRIKLVANKISDSAAVAAALEECRSDGGRDCRVIDQAYSNACLSVARVARNPGPRLDNYGIGRSSNPKSADVNAVSDCEAFTHQRCVPKFQSCSPDSLLPAR